MNYKNPTKLVQTSNKKIVLSASIKIESRNLASSTPCQKQSIYINGYHGNSLPSLKRQCNAQSPCLFCLLLSILALLPPSLLFSSLSSLSLSLILRAHKAVTPGVHPSPILFISSPNFLLVILLPPLPPSGACSSGS